MQDFGNIIYRPATRVYVIKDGTYAVPHPEDPSVPEKIHKEFDSLYIEIEEYAKANPDKVSEELPHEPSPEEIAQEELLKNQEAADILLRSRVNNILLQTDTFSSSEFSLLAKAKMFEEWQSGKVYETGFRLVYKGIVYEVVQKVTAIEGQYPGAEGMLAIYRPLSVDASTGEEPDGSKEKPFNFIYGMDVSKDMYYTYNGSLYIAKADMPACVWTPDTVGLWQWELVE